MPKPTIFISYSREDEGWKDKLVKHLTALDQEIPLEVWHDRRIGGGGNWREEIQSAINRARIAIVLVSVDFLLSQFIREEEVPRLLDRRERGGMLVYPVIVKECGWRKVRWLSAINARPQDGKPLEELQSNKVNRALATIASEILDRLEEEKSGSASESFLATYRRCLSATYSHWDLAHAGVAQAGGASAPIEAKLDDMYLPLRLAVDISRYESAEGCPISPQDLLSRERPLVIRGAAGSGKTTWMRWTFRRLLQLEEAFPLMLVLSDLARRWQDPQCKGASRSLDIFLEEWVAGLLGSGLEGELKKLMADKKGPRPVLLVDGWDETGPLGKELREKLLVLMKHYPRLQVVVTSRPYGEARPSHAEGFDLLDIQPLSDDEIGQLSYRFFTTRYGQDEAAATKEVESFLRALSRAPEPQALARTALLLTMMLLISRSGPLPDKRHLLYEVCIENFLTALPERKAEEGALLQREQWRPDDSEERMRVVAALAFSVQSEAYKNRSRATVIREWAEAAELLPAEWSKAKRMGFLAWLAGPAGLLTDRADGTLVFSHLSFQEFLVAWHLNASVEGTEPRMQEFSARMKNNRWRETLRLWAALIERQNPMRLDSLIEKLISIEGGLALVGAVLADGLGNNERFQSWLRNSMPELNSIYSVILGCSDAWASSSQEVRKRALYKAIQSEAAKATWVSWVRLRSFAEHAGYDQGIPHPETQLSRAITTQLYNKPTIDALHIAAGRILSEADSLWPSPLRALQAWPSHRRLAGMRLQLAVSCGKNEGLEGLARIFCTKSDWMQVDLLRLQKVLQDMMPHSMPPEPHSTYKDKEYAGCLTSDLVGYVEKNYAGYAGNMLVPYLVESLPGYSTHKIMSVSAIDFYEDFCCAPVEDLAALASEFASAHQIKMDAWLGNFCTIDLRSFGRIGGRAEQAYEREYSCPDSIDPLWQALARHLDRRSTAADRALLNDLAKHPEHRDPPLSWGLQYIVRGDVMLEDGSVVTLDELADEVGLPHLPYLEEMPDELEIDWDKKDETNAR